MNPWYIDVDTRENLYYVVPFPAPKPHYMIRFKARYQADQFLKDLMIGKSKDPLKNPELYHLIETLKDERGEVQVFEPKVS